MSSADFDFTVGKALCLENTSTLPVIVAGVTASFLISGPAGLIGGAVYGAMYSIVGQPIHWVCNLVGVHCAKIKDTAAKVGSAVIAFFSTNVLLVVISSMKIHGISLMLGYSLSLVGSVALCAATAGIGFGIALIGALIVYLAKRYIKNRVVDQDVSLKGPDLRLVKPTDQQSIPQAAKLGCGHACMECQVHGTSGKSEVKLKEVAATVVETPAKTPKPLAAKKERSKKKPDHEARNDRPARNRRSTGKC